MLESKEQSRARNLAARDAAKPVRVPYPKTRTCGLCDATGMSALVAVKRFDGKGGVFACGKCMHELLGKESPV